MDISAEYLVVLFFDDWFCKNSLPLEIVSDHNKLFISCFWKALTGLCSMNLKMSSSYHPQTDGSSKRSNKTINQSLCYHVDHSQKGWVALPCIRFDMMNSVNASTGFSNFQLHLGHSPQLIPPIVLADLPEDLCSPASVAEDLITQIHTDIMEAKDNLFQVKIYQEHHINTHCGNEFFH